MTGPQPRPASGPPHPPGGAEEAGGDRRAVLTLALLLGMLASSEALAVGTTADRVLGQVNFTSNGPNLIDDVGLARPTGIAVDKSVAPNRLYVSDTGNNRVLGWTSTVAFVNGEPADLVIGQPDFSSYECNNGGLSASSLCGPAGIAVDGAGNLYVTDANMDRVLEYDTPFTSDAVADRVFGQGGSFTTGSCFFPVGPNSLCFFGEGMEGGIAIDPAGNVYIADTNANRVLQYNTPLTTDTTADRVFGQATFTTSSCATSATGLCQPRNVALDAAGNLYVADQRNNRVLEYNTPLTTDTTADRVFGTGGNFNGGGCLAADAANLCRPNGLAVDTAGNLYIGDTNLNRVLQYNTPLTTDTTADRVFGHGGSFTAFGCNDGGLSANSLCVVSGGSIDVRGALPLALDGSGNLYVADQGNNRVLEFDTPIASGTTADRVLGQTAFTRNARNLTDARGFSEPQGVAIDRSVTPNRLYVADTTSNIDTANSRVLAWANVTAYLNGDPADLVIGQPDMFTWGCNTGGLSASSLCWPRGLDVDAAGNLYVVDSANHRVLEYNTPFTSGTTADRVFGQGGSFTATNSCNTGGVSANSLCDPYGVTVDAAGNLYVADRQNNRVLEYNTPLTSGTTADRVFGQGGSFTTNTLNAGGLSANSLWVPATWQSTRRGNLYIADDGNKRVLEYNTPLVTDTTADRVFGQGGSFTGNACNLGGVSASSMCNPQSVALDPAGNLYVADIGNNRVLEYNTPLTTDTTADRVFGQGGSFTSTTANLGGLSATSLSFAIGVAIDATGNLYVSDALNYRVLKFIGPLSTCGNNVLEAGEACDDGNTIGGDCCSSICLFEASGTVCRTAAGVCDVAETCTGTSSPCPADAKSPSGTVCRSSAGVCDPAEVCNGSSAACPADALSPSGTVCRSSAGVCDPAESCTGSSATCPADALASSSTVCRAAAGVCDVAENCTGSSAACPANAFVSSSTVCRRGRRLRRRGELHGVERRLSRRRLRALQHGVPRRGRRLRRRRELHRVERGLSGRCFRVVEHGVPERGRRLRRRGELHRVERRVPGRCLRASSTVCRAAAGVCDVAENCTGSSAALPGRRLRSSEHRLPRLGRRLRRRRELHGVERRPVRPTRSQSSSTVCRAAAGVCDVAENCTGVERRLSRRLLRVVEHGVPGVGGLCDVAENCTGSSAACPADAFASSSTVCRAAAGVCDVAESCTGSSATVRPTRFASSSTVCRPSAGVCDVAENCTGSSAACPADAFALVQHGLPAVGRVSATSPRTARRRAPPARPTPSRSSGTVCRAVGRRLRRRRELHRLERGLSGGCVRVVEHGVPRVGRRLRRGRELHGRRAPPARPTPSCRRAPCAASSAGVCDVAENCTGRAPPARADAFASSSTVCRPRPASATSPRTAPARARPARPTPSQSSSTVCRAVGGRLRRRRELHRVERGVSRRRVRVVEHGVPRRGRRLRRRRELHRVERGVSGGCLQSPRARSAARAAERLRRRGELHGVERRVPGDALRLLEHRLPRRRPASATSPRTAPASSAACPADASSPRARRAAPRPASATWRRTAPARAPPARPMRSSHRAPTCRAVGRRLRRRRELHRRRAPPARPTPSCPPAPSAAPRPASATSPRTAPASSAACPADAFAVVRAPCAAPSAGVCDVAENCTGVERRLSGRRLRIVQHGLPRRRPASATSPRTAPASSATCPADAFAASSDACAARRPASATSPRAARGRARLPGRCLRVASTVCRAAAGVCDVAENCTGVERRLPGRRLRVHRHRVPRRGRRLRRRRELHRVQRGVSRGCVRVLEHGLPRAAGVCDVAENCTGSSAACPADAKTRSGPVCRASAGVCDVAEACDGSSAACPADAFAPTSVVCRSAAGVCDVAESCTGIGRGVPGGREAGERDGLHTRRQRVHARPVRRDEHPVPASGGQYRGRMPRLGRRLRSAGGVLGDEHVLSRGREEPGRDRLPLIGGLLRRRRRLRRRRQRLPRRRRRHAAAAGHGELVAGRRQRRRHPGRQRRHVGGPQHRLRPRQGR